MTTAIVSAERLRELFHYEPETGLFTRLESRRGRYGEAGHVAGTLHRGYVKINVSGRSYKLHRLAWLYVHGVWPTDQIDHINGFRNDNRLANLREATTAQNQQNRRKAQKNNKSGMLGVCWSKDHKMWNANITTNRKKHYLGYFLDIQLAHAAYLKAKRELHPMGTI